MNTKNISILVVVLALALGLAYWYKSSNTTDGGRVMNGETQDEGKLKADTFSGTLEEVNTGCFADAECYVVVDGKHVTTTIGWSQNIVGTIQGVASFGDLEGHIGEEVEVYAQDNSDGTYTLYGSEGFYVKLK